MRRIAVLDAPSNLGLRPPTVTSVPGCAKAPGALRDQGLLTRLNARDAGCLTPPRYDAGDWRPGDGVAHAPQIAAYSKALADRIGAILDVGEFPVILGGDCSILLGSGLAMHRLGEAVGGRIGLVFVDGHSDFRHPGNASYVGAAAGEDLALVTGRGQADLASIENRRPYFRDIDVVVLGIRAQDEHRLDLQAAGIVTRPVPALRAEGAARSAQWARDQLVDCAGYWVHVDVDVLDPAVMPAVDAPSPGGIAFPELEILLAGLVGSPHCLGVEITVFDPDYDPDGQYAAEITSAVVSGLAAAHTVTPRPDLIAARATYDGAAEPRGAVRGFVGAGQPNDETVRRFVSHHRDRGADPEAAPESGAPESGAAGSGGRAFLRSGDDALPGSGDDALPGAGGGASDASGSHAFPASDSFSGSGGGALGGSERGGFGGSDGGVLPAHGGASTAGDDETAREHRRAAAASASVSLAAAGMSVGPDSAPEEVGAPATTMLGVEEADDLAEIDDFPRAADDDAVAYADETDGEDGEDGEAEAQADLAQADHAQEAEMRESETHAAEFLADRAREDQAREGHEAEAAAQERDAGAQAHDGQVVEARGDEAREENAEEAATRPGESQAEPADHWQPTPAPAAYEPNEPDQPVIDANERAVRLATRPLGSAPLLDSEPLPATRPGMLRPRNAEDSTAPGFSLPVQRPAFELDSDEPADIA